MTFGKTVIGIILLAAAVILFFMGHIEIAQAVGTLGAGLVGIGFAHKLDKVIAALAVFKK